MRGRGLARLATRCVPALATLATLAAAAVGAGCSMPSAIAPSLKGSVGVPHAGFLTDAAELPKQGHGFVWRTRFDHHYALPRMIALLEQAADAVATAHPGTPPLYVGELSAKGGGALMPKHRSHRTGRDVDLMFFRSRPDGVPIAGDDFAKLGADGLGVDTHGAFVRFDVAREWSLVRALLSSNDAHVQWMFIARPLEAMLIEHAIALGEPSALIARAEQVLQQPGDSLPHDDHLHLRLACEPDELSAGCDGGGPRWAWLPQATVIEASEGELLDALLGASVLAAPEPPLAAAAP